MDFAVLLCTQCTHSEEQQWTICPQANLVHTKHVRILINLENQVMISIYWYECDLEQLIPKAWSADFCNDPTLPVGEMQIYR